MRKKTIQKKRIKRSRIKRSKSKLRSKKLRRGGAISLICDEFKNNEGKYKHILDVFNIDKTYYKISIEINSMRFISIKSFREIIKLRDTLSSDKMKTGSLREEYPILCEESVKMQSFISSLKTSKLTKRISQHFKLRYIREKDCTTRFNEINYLFSLIEKEFVLHGNVGNTYTNILNKHGFFRFDLKLLDSPLNEERVKGLVIDNPNNIAIVDPAGRGILTEDPDKATGFSGDLYKQLNDAGQEVTKIDISKFTEGISIKNYRNLSIIHSLGYDFRSERRFDADKKEEGEEYLKKLYKDIIKEGNDKGLETLQFVPISGGVFGGSSIPDFPELTINWIKTAIDELSSTITTPVIELYILFPNEAKKYLRAIKKIEAELLKTQ